VGEEGGEAKKGWRFGCGELAAVVFVVLVVGYFVARALPRRVRPNRLARQQVKCLAVSLDHYVKDLGEYPPEDIVVIGGSAEHGMSEALVHYLGQPLSLKGKTQIEYFRMRDTLLTDEDTDGFKEYRDPWGGAWFYAREALAPGATQSGKAPRFFDIASPGPDGKLGGQMVPGKGYVPATTAEGKAAEADNVTNWGK
jgi:hypothetical protein